MVLGIGALATGSGAAFSSAAFQSSVNPAADMRVVVDGDLVVEAGDAFRNGDGDYRSSISDGEFYGVNQNEFFSTADPSQGGEDSLGSGFSTDDLPIASVNGDQNEILSIQTAVKNDTSHTFEELLQVRNEGTEPVDVGVKFEEFGVDTDGRVSDNGGEVDEANVVKAYEFKSDSNPNNENPISYNQGVNENRVPDTDAQTVNNVVTVSPGETEQISLEIDLTVNRTGELSEQIEDAATIGDSFTGGENGTEDTVQLIDSIRIGADSAGETDELSGS
jgi:hypothetical protein